MKEEEEMYPHQELLPHWRVRIAQQLRLLNSSLRTSSHFPLIWMKVFVSPHRIWRKKSYLFFTILYQQIFRSYPALALFHFGQYISYRFRLLFYGQTAANNKNPFSRSFKKAVVFLFSFSSVGATDARLRSMTMVTTLVVKKLAAVMVVWFFSLILATRWNDSPFRIYNQNGIQIYCLVKFILLFASIKTSGRIVWSNVCKFFKKFDGRFDQSFYNSLFKLFFLNYLWKRFHEAYPG